MLGKHLRIFDGEGSSKPAPPEQIESHIEYGQIEERHIRIITNMSPFNRQKLRKVAELAMSNNIDLDYEKILDMYENDKEGFTEIFLNNRNYPSILHQT